MKSRFKLLPTLPALFLLFASGGAWAQEEKAADTDTAKKEEKAPAITNEFRIGAWYLGEDSYRFGKYSGLTDKGAEALLDFRVEKRPEWDSGDTVRWRLQGWRLGLDSRRLEFDYLDQGTQRFRFDYREIPNNRFSDGRTPYRGEAAGLWKLAPEWQVAPGSSNTRGFTALQESLVDLKVDTKRRWMDLSYDRKLGANWALDVDFRHETKEGARTLGSIFGSSASNPRSVILPAPVDWTTDIIEAMFHYTTARAQFGLGIYGSFFSNDESTLVFQNAYGYRNGWAPGVRYPEAYGRSALEPDNEYIQFKAYGGMNLARGTRLTADFAYGRMRQDDALLDWSINPTLDVHTPVPLDSLDAEVNTTMFNLRLTSNFARRFSLAANYRYDDRDNKTPQAIWPYIAGDAQNQRRFQDGRINRPYSYTRQKADATLSWRFARASRLRAGVEYVDYSRDYQEVNDSDEFTWLAGLTLRGWSSGSLNFDYRNSNRDVDAYIGNAPYINSRVPGTVDDDEWENHPLLRKYYLTDRDRQQYRVRADYAPSAIVNLGFAASYAEDDYDDAYFGLNNAKVRSLSIDGGFHPSENIALTGFYTKEKYEAEQSAVSFFSPGSAFNPDYYWQADTTDKVDTWNVALTVSGIGVERGWRGFDLGFGYTVSDTRSDIDVAAATLLTSPLPRLGARMRSFSLWGNFPVTLRSSIRLTAESADLSTSDWALDGVEPDTLANVLLLGEDSPDYDLWLVSASWSYRFW